LCVNCIYSVKNEYSKRFRYFSVDVYRIFLTTKWFDYLMVLVPNSYNQKINDKL